MLFNFIACWVRSKFGSWCSHWCAVVQGSLWDLIKYWWTSSPEPGNWGKNPSEVIGNDLVLSLFQAGRMTGAYYVSEIMIKEGVLLMVNQQGDIVSDGDDKIKFKIID